MKDQKMIDLFYIERVKEASPGPLNDLLFSTLEKAEEHLDEMTTGTFYPRSDYEVKSFQVNPKCAARSYTQTTMVLLDVSAPNDVRIVAADTIVRLHRRLSIPLNWELERATDGRYCVMSMEYFHDHYKISKS